MENYKEKAKTQLQALAYKLLLLPDRII